MEIRPKKFNFNLSKYWFDNNRLKTYFWNANSILFEQSEYVFCKIVRHFNKKVKDAELEKEVDILFQQESWHSFNHRAFNEEISRHYNTKNVTYNAKLLTNRVLLLNNQKKLSYATCFEQLIVNITNTLLSHPFKKTDKEISDFWRWHALEEKEHGYVGIKLYRYFKFSKILNKLHLLHLTYMYCKYIISSMLEFYIQDRNLNKLKGTT